MDEVWLVSPRRRILVVAVAVALGVAVAAARRQPVDGLALPA
jgi:hypothetical protein